jgi:hypothetical protein
MNRTLDCPADACSLTYIERERGARTYAPWCGEIASRPPLTIEQKNSQAHMRAGAGREQADTQPRSKTPAAPYHPKIGRPDVPSSAPRQGGTHVQTYTNAGFPNRGGGATLHNSSSTCYDQGRATIQMFEDDGGGGKEDDSNQDSDVGWDGGGGREWTDHQIYDSHEEDDLERNDGGSDGFRGKLAASKRYKRISRIERTERASASSASLGDGRVVGFPMKMAVAMRISVIYLCIGVACAFILIFSGRWLLEAKELSYILPWMDTEHAHAAPIEPNDGLDRTDVRSPKIRGGHEAGDGSLITPVDDRTADSVPVERGDVIHVTRAKFDMKMTGPTERATPMVGILPGISRRVKIVAITAVCVDSTGGMVVIPVGPRPQPRTLTPPIMESDAGYLTEFIIQLTEEADTEGQGGGVVTARAGADLPPTGAPWVCSVAISFSR